MHRGSTPRSRASGPPDGCGGLSGPCERSRGTILGIADEVGVHPEALRTWVKKAEINQGTRPGTTTDDAQRTRGLEAGNRALHPGGDPDRPRRHSDLGPLIKAPL